MKVYLYTKANKNAGLDSIRRYSAIAKLLEERNCETILCTSDFKSTTFAKNQLKIKNHIMIEQVSDLEKTVQKGDIVFIDSDKIENSLEDNLKSICTFYYKIPEDIPTTIIDKKIFKKQNSKEKEKVFFFGDEDNSSILLNMCKESKKYDIPLLLGNCFFLGDKKTYEKCFPNIIEDQLYISTIQNTKYLLTTSLYSCFESIYSGNKPVLLKRKDKAYDDKLIKKLHLPTINYDSLDNIFLEFEKIIKQYPKLNKPEPFDIESIVHDIGVRIETYKKLSSL